MPDLDPILHAPERTGPTLNMAAKAAAEPVYRQERFQLMPKRLPVRLTGNMKPRPRSRSGTGSPVGISAGYSLPVLVRHSNQRPLEAGTGFEAQRWNVSDPAWFRGGLAGDEGTAGKVAIGVAVGLAAFLLLRKRG